MIEITIDLWANIALIAIYAIALLLILMSIPVKFWRKLK